MSATTDAPADESIAHLQEGDQVLMFIRGSSNLHQIAGAIAQFHDQGLKVRTRSIGASSVNQAVKGAAVARRMLREQGKHLAIFPEFEDIQTTDGTRSSMVLHMVIY